MFNFQQRIAGILLVILCILVTTTGCDSNSNRSTAKQTTPNKYAGLTEYAVPYSGEVNAYQNKERVAPLQIKAGIGGHYLVKLVDYNSHSPVMTVFVRGGSNVAVEVPLGNYELRYASGDRWFGYNNLFGPDTAYSKADTNFNFRSDGYQVSGYTVTLYRVSGGNLRTSRLQPGQF